MNEKIIQKINTVFEGDFHDKTPSHKNSLCRIAYCGFLANRGVKTREIIKQTTWISQEVVRRKRRHLDLYQFNPEYKRKFDSLFENL